MISRLKRGVLSLATLLLAPAALAGTLYVDANLTTGLGDGSSWANAFQGTDGLQAALAASVSGDQIFVAQGTYLPSATGVRSTSFLLKTGVEVYGSFLGTESAPAERPPFGTAPSILNGDLAGNDGSNLFNDNSYHVVNAAGTNATAVLDGFTVTAGNGNGSGNFNKGGGILCIGAASPTVRNCRFVLNRCTFGGGAGYINGALPSFTDCSFEDNIGGSFGGAFDIAFGGAVRFDRCRFTGNRAARAGALEIFATNGAVVTNSVFADNLVTGSSGGGAIWIGNGGSVTLRNLTVVSNSATVSAFGGVRVSGSTVSIANSVLWDNTGSGGAQGAINQVGGTTNVTYCIVMGGLAGTGNLNADPSFADPGAGDYALTLASPAVDAGNNTAVPAGITLDIALNARFADEPTVPDTGAGSAPIVDIGAYELRPGIGFPDVGCVPAANSTGSPGALTATGSLAVADNDVELNASSLPANEFGYFLMSESTGTLPVASGVLCLGSPQYRFNGDILGSGAAGVMDFSPDMTDLPQGQVFQPGETWYFQLWHRDGASSNFTSDLGFTWQ